MFSNLHVLPKKAIVMQNSGEMASTGNKKVVENVRVISRDNVVGIQQVHQ